MEEKIKISIPKSTYDILIKDCEAFKFFKTNETLNKNQFINTLIMNYYEHFSSDEEKLHDEIKKALNNACSLNEDLFNDIIKIIAKRENTHITDSTTVSLHFKPTKLSFKAINYIENVLIKNEAISSYYRRLFNSYANHPLNQRELIIFKDNVDLIHKAINKKVKVCITLTSGAVNNDASIYKLASSKDELYNYVLICDTNGNPHTIRLANILDCSLLSASSNIPENIKEIFERQIKYGAQYPIMKNETDEIAVKLSDRGIELFKRIYLYRPQVERIDGNIYYFKCSYNQITHYFKRFGNDALILSPTKLGEQMKNYYHYAGKAYKELYPYKKQSH